MFGFFDHQRPARGRSGSLAIGLSLGCLSLSFVALAFSVRTGRTRLDSELATLLHGKSGVVHSSPLAQSFWQDVTVLGSWPIIALVVALVLGYLVLAGHGRTAAAFGLGIALAVFSSYFFKGLFERPRPMALEVLVDLDSYSFPSGHSVVSGALYPMLGALIAQVVDGRRLKAYCAVSGVLLMVLVGCSRVYLGVHYATDVLAGWSLGLAWALVSGVVMARLRRKGLVETEPIAIEGR
jgi:undecaprenyl-diphosphatase